MEMEIDVKLRMSVNLEKKIPNKIFENYSITGQVIFCEYRNNLLSDFGFRYSIKQMQGI